MWGCRVHWYLLPERLRREVWAAYVEGQEISKTPSLKYIEVVRRVQTWCLAHNAINS